MKFIVTSDEECPEQCHQGTRITREDMKTSHEEADVIIPQQVSLKFLKSNFLLMIEQFVCIKSSVERNMKIIPSLLSVHAFGCDTGP